MISQSVSDLVAEGGRSLPSDDSIGDVIDDDRRRLMSAHSIHYDGRRYRYNGYRYDRVADAVAYAELMQSRQSTRAGPDPFTPDDIVPSPSASDRDIMAALSISFRAGVYAYREFRYDHLADAVSYAYLDRRDRVSG